MPQALKNPIFLRRGGLRIRRCWHATHTDILSQDMFSTDANPHARESVDGAFNVNDLPTFAGKPYTDRGRRAAIREAIDKKVGVFAEADPGAPAW